VFQIKAVAILKPEAQWGLRRGFQNRENADMGHKMPFMDGHELSIIPDLSPAHLTLLDTKCNDLLPLLGHTASIVAGVMFLPPCQ
jgi:hypothetical protein